MPIAKAGVSVGAGVGVGRTSFCPTCSNEDALRLLSRVITSHGIPVVAPIPLRVSPARTVYDRSGVTVAVTTAVASTVGVSATVLVISAICTVVVAMIAVGVRLGRAATGGLVWVSIDAFCGSSGICTRAVSRLH